MAISITNSDVLRALCQNHMSLVDSYNDNIKRIREFLFENNIKSREECNQFSKEIQQYFYEGLNNADKLVLTEASEIARTIGKSKEQKTLMKRKSNIDTKIKYHYEKMLNSVYGDPFPLYPSPTPIEAINATIVELSVPVESNKRKSEAVIVSPGTPSYTAPPVFKISFKHKAQLQTFIMNDKAGMLYKYTLFMLEQRHQEIGLLTGKTKTPFNDVLEDYKELDIEWINCMYNSFIKDLEHPMYAEVGATYGFAFYSNPLDIERIDAMMDAQSDITDIMIERFEELDIDFK
jgi:hypothetical protein